MRFSLVDRIVQLEPGAHITAVKTVSLAEEYLADHFPQYPVLPGVMMLEAMTQASAWLIRASEDFAHSVVVLKEARNVKYANFLSPGQTLTVHAQLVGQDERDTKLKVEGTVNGETYVSGRLVLERYNLADTRPEDADTDRIVISQMKNLLTVLYRPTKVPAKEMASQEALPQAETSETNTVQS